MLVRLLFLSSWIPLLNSVYPHRHQPTSDVFCWFHPLARLYQKFSSLSSTLYPLFWIVCPSSLLEITVCLKTDLNNICKKKYEHCNQIQSYPKYGLTINRILKSIHHGLPYQELWAEVIWLRTPLRRACCSSATHERLLNPLFSIS